MSLPLSVKKGYEASINCIINPVYCVSSGVQQFPPVAAQDLQAVFKSGYLEKRRKGWQTFTISIYRIFQVVFLIIHIVTNKPALSGRSQLLWYRVAEKILRSEQPHILLLWEWERYDRLFLFLMTSCVGLMVNHKKLHFLHWWTV